MGLVMMMFCTSVVCFTLGEDWTKWPKLQTGEEVAALVGMQQVTSCVLHVLQPSLMGCYGVFQCWEYCESSAFHPGIFSWECGAQHIGPADVGADVAAGSWVSSVLATCPPQRQCLFSVGKVLLSLDLYIFFPPFLKSLFALIQLLERDYRPRIKSSCN